MPRPILRLATRIDRRTRWTAWAIAVACMVLVGALSLVDGLSAGVDTATARFASGPSVYLRGTDLLSSTIDETTLTSIPTDYSVLRLHAGTLTANGVTQSVIVGALEDLHGGNATVPFPNGTGQVAVDTGLASQIAQASGAPLGTSVNLTLLGIGPAEYPVAPSPASRPVLFPDTWAWVRPELLIAMNPALGGPAQAVLTPSPLDTALVARLGLTRLQTVGAVGFVQASVAEAGTVLLALAALVAVVIGLVVLQAMGLEVVLRREEIRTLRSLGASTPVVLAVYEGQALLLALLGATVGSALGIAVVHGIVSFAPLVGLPNLVVFQAPVTPVLLGYAVALAASAVAGLVPAIRAALSLRRRPGAVPS